jgi:hypothetical protein
MAAATHRVRMKLGITRISHIGRVDAVAKENPRRAPFWRHVRYPFGTNRVGAGNSVHSVTGFPLEAVYKCNVGRRRRANQIRNLDANFFKNALACPSQLCQIENYTSQKRFNVQPARLIHFHVQSCNAPETIKHTPSTARPFWARRSTGWVPWYWATMARGAAGGC